MPQVTIPGIGTLQGPRTKDVRDALAGLPINPANGRRQIVATVAPSLAKPGGETAEKAFSFGIRLKEAERSALDLMAQRANTNAAALVERIVKQAVQEAGVAGMAATGLASLYSK